MPKDPIHIDMSHLAFDLRDRLLVPPKPPDPTWSEHRRRHQRHLRRLWYARRALYIRKGWPVVLATVFARFRRNLSFTKQHVRDIDAALEAMRREGFTKAQIDRWAESMISNLMDSEKFQDLVKELFEEYKKYLDKRKFRITRFLVRRKKVEAFA